MKSNDSAINQQWICNDSAMRPAMKRPRSALMPSHSGKLFGREAERSSDSSRARSFVRRTAGLSGATAPFAPISRFASSFAIRRSSTRNMGSPLRLVRNEKSGRQGRFRFRKAGSTGRAQFLASHFAIRANDEKRQVKNEESLSRVKFRQLMRRDFRKARGPAAPP